MVNNHYRWDFIGLSTDEKPTPQTSEKVVDGSTFYTSDNSKLYVWCKDQWYEKTVEGGGGGGTSNFNQLTNRPKFNGVTMTGDTDIPEDFKILTDADVNYTEEWSGNEYIALWKLESGNYRISPEASVSIGVNVIDDGGDVVVETVLVPSDDTYTFKVYNPDPNTSDVRFTIFSTIFIQEVYTDKNGYLKNTGIVNPYRSFIGISGNVDGTMGLVPAPIAATDADKFLKSDGTWASAGGDAFTELTSADYNYPTDNPDGVAVWLLPLGLYKLASGTKCYFTRVNTYTGDEYNPRYFGVMADRIGSIAGRKFILMFAIHYSSGSHNRDTLGCYTVINGVSSDYESRLLLKQGDIANNLTTTSIGYALDATQGKVLDDKITALEARVAALEGN